MSASSGGPKGTEESSERNPTYWNMFVGVAKAFAQNDVRRGEGKQQLTLSLRKGAHEARSGGGAWRGTGKRYTWNYGRVFMNPGEVLCGSCGTFPAPESNVACLLDRS